MASFDIIINVIDKHVSTHIGHKSKYSTSKTTAVVHPGTENKIEGWKWGEAKWPSYAELSQFSYIPILFDAGSTIPAYYFQSGYGYDTDLFLKRTALTVISNKNLWSPQILTGNYHIYNKEWYLFSDQYVTETLLLPTHVLGWLPKKLPPVFVRRFGRDTSTSQLYIVKELTKTLESPSSTEFLFDVSTSLPTITTSGVTAATGTKTFTTTSETKVVFLDTFPVSVTSITADSTPIWDGTGSAPTGWVVDNDLGQVKLPDSHGFTSVVIDYTETFSVSYEPHFATDTVSATSADVNPVHNGANKGFVQITTENLEPFSIHLESDLPTDVTFNSANYFLELGNNVAKLTATVKNRVGTLLEGIKVYFDWDLPSDLSSITDANGQALMYYNSPTALDSLGHYVSQDDITFGTDTTTISIENISAATSLERIWTFAVYHTDPFFGLENQAAVNDDYKTFLEGEGFDYDADEQLNEIEYRNINFADLHNPAKPEAIDGMTDPEKQGQKRLILKEMEAAPFTHPNTGADASSTNKVWWPISPQGVNEDGVVYNTNDLPNETERLQINSYFVVYDKVETIRAYAYNNAGEKVYSNTIRITLTLPDSANGVYYSTALAEPFVSNLLRGFFAHAERSLEPGDTGFQGPPNVPFNYPGFYDPNVETVDNLDGNDDPVFVPLAQPTVKIPVGFRVVTPASGITVASLLNQITFINPHGQAEEPT